jgi:taurine dioxygenase
MSVLENKSAIEAAVDLGIAFHPAGAVLGAEVTGLDLRQPLSAAQVAAIRAGLLHYKVLFFRDQDVTHEEHLRFGRYFGPLEGHPVTTSVPGHPEILHIEAADGMKLVDATVPYVRAANKWHTDVTFREKPSMGGILRMRKMPPAGGDTLFADTAAVLADIQEPMRSRLETLDAEHDILQSFGFRVTPEERETLRRDYPPVTHPVVIRHPETGAKHLFVNHVFTTRILGVSEEESRDLLHFLTDRVKCPEYQVRFRWTPNTIVFWDNRATQHYAALDYWPHERIVERVTVAGTERPSR